MNIFIVLGLALLGYGVYTEVKPKQAKSNEAPTPTTEKKTEVNPLANVQKPAEETK